MNIQDTIKELGLENETLPRILGQRVATVEDLQSKLALAEKEVEKDPTEESKEKLQEVKDYTVEYFNDAKEQLKSFKAKLDKKAKEEAEAKAKKEEEAKAKEEEEAKAKTEEDKAKAESKEEVEVLDAKPVEEEKKSSGMGALLIGGVLLVATLGAVNILRKR